MKNEKLEMQVTNEPTVKTASTDAVITVKMKPEEKSLLIKKAVEESGLTVSEFIRYKLFNETPENKSNNADIEYKEVIEDEERQAYEDLIKNQRTAIADLTEKLYKLKAAEIDLANTKTALSISNANKDFLSKLLTDEGKEILLKKRSIFGGRYDNDLSKLAESDLVNASLNYIKELTDENELLFQNSFVQYLKEKSGDK